MIVALTRQLSRSFERCQLTHLERQPIDLNLARQQHADYELALQKLGCQLLQLPEQPDQPDSVFVEDTAVVLDELAVMARPGAKSRRPEVPSVHAALSSYRQVQAITAPGRLDGGDVLALGRELYVGISSRTNRRGIQQLRQLATPFGYRVHAVPLHGCLHLKSAVSQVGEEELLLNPDWIDASIFRDFQLLEVHPNEPLAANALWLAGTVIYPLAFPKTRERLEASGCRVQALDISELGKAEGGVTCCSLVFTA